MTTLVGAEDFEEFDTHDDILFFGAHVPNILLYRCVKSFYEDNASPSRAQPFIERFYGALLFVDISGFTALSRCIQVERLKTYINAYFTKMLDVVEKYKGSVTKFAGDALYIIWPATVTDSIELCVQRAFLCSVDITRDCNNYAVSMDESSDLPPSPTAFALSPRIMKRRDSPVIYMNVHSGISVGTMAAVDVGCNGRWEMLLLGQPLTDVSIAVNEAQSGEIVLSRMAFKILDKGIIQGTTNLYSVEERALGCMCVSSQPPEEDTFWRDRDFLDDCNVCYGGGKKTLVGALLHEQYCLCSNATVDFSQWLLEPQQVQAKQYIMDSIKVSAFSSAYS